MKPADPVEGVIVVSRADLPRGSVWVVAGDQDAKAKATRSYVLVRLEEPVLKDQDLLEAKARVLKEGRP